MQDRNLDSYNHGDALLCYFQQLQQNDQFLDVMAQSDGEYIAGAHRLLLAAFSTHFETVLAGVEVERSANITLEIDPKITNVSADNLHRVIEFMYTGRAANRDGLIESAKTLGCVSLVQLLESEEASDGAMVEDAAHSQRLLESIYRFKIDGRFTDVIINCQSQPVASCHRLVLCAYSDHFEAVLSATESCPLITLEIDSAVTGVTGTDLKTIVDFMYTGTLRTPKRRFRSLLAAGKALGVSKIVEVLTVSSVNTPNNNPSSATTVNSRTIESKSGRSIAKIGGLDKNDDDDDNDYDEKNLHNRIIVSSGGNVVKDDIGLSGRQTFVDTLDGGQYGHVSVVGATEDVGSGQVESGQTPAVMLHDDNFGAEETTGREVTASDDYVDIYEEYVAGPRRGRKGGTYGRRLEPLRIKGPAKIDISTVDSNSSIQLFGHTNAPGDSAGLSSEDVNAVTMSYTPTGKKRRYTDSYGYGLPEIVGTNDVTVPLLVGNQQAMMEKPFKCPYCDHRTKEKSAVEKHIRCIHTLEAPYKCRYCSQAFKVQSNLVRHIRAHTGEKPYVCKKCGAAYADKKNMDAHVFREHFKMKPLECPEPECNAKFWRQDRFVHHCRKSHNYDPEITNVLL